MELSQNELYILEFLWKENTPQGFANILSYFNSVTNKNWKKQTMSTYITRLIKAGFIKTDHSGTKLQYYPAITRNDYYQNIASDIVEESFSGSLSFFVSAFTGKNKISADEKEKLIDYLKGL